MPKPDWLLIYDEGRARRIQFRIGVFIWDAAVIATLMWCIRHGAGPVAFALVAFAGPIMVFALAKYEGGKLREFWDLRKLSWGFLSQAFVLGPLTWLEASQWDSLGPNPSWVPDWIPDQWYDTWQWTVVCSAAGAAFTAAVRIGERVNFDPLRYHGRGKTYHDVGAHMIVITVPVLFGAIPLLINGHWGLISVPVLVSVLVLSWLGLGQVDLKRAKLVGSKWRMVRELLHAQIDQHGRSIIPSIPNLPNMKEYLKMRAQKLDYGGPYRPG
ncbi:MAG: hypothetical protein JWN01_431 [Patescibacteria group bacterium]|nr:hypothetical protein [Patescibacteria group bacterium]